MVWMLKYYNEFKEGVESVRSVLNERLAKIFDEVFRGLLKVLDDVRSEKIDIDEQEAGKPVSVACTFPSPSAWRSSYRATRSLAIRKKMFGVKYLIEAYSFELPMVFRELVTYARCLKAAGIYMKYMEMLFAA